MIQVPKEKTPKIIKQLDLTEPGCIDDAIEEIFSRENLPKNGYPLHSGKLVLAQTKEYIEFVNPETDNLKINLNEEKVTQFPGTVLAGRIEGRSSFARAGLLVHFTAPTLHAYLGGKITLELMNLGPLAIILKPGAPICQLIIEDVSGIPKKKWDGDQQFQDQDMQRKS